MVLLKGLLTREEADSFLEEMNFSSLFRSLTMSASGKDLVARDRTSEQLWCQRSCEERSPTAQSLVRRV